MKRILAIFLLSIVILLNGQYRFTRLGILNGLSQNSVEAIFEDTEGFIWLGTQDGLNRYDGYTFLTFRHSKSDSASLSDNFVTALCEDVHHNLWVGTRNGMNFFDRRTQKFIRVFPKGMDRNFFHNAVRDVFPAGNGVAYLANGYVFYSEYDSIHAIVINHIAMNGIASGFSAEENNGDFYAIEHDSVKHFHFDNGKYTRDRFLYYDSIFTPAKTVGLFVAEPYVWISAGKKLVRIYSRNGAVAIKSAGENWGSVFSKDGDGNLWIGGENGVLVCDKEMNVISSVRANPSSQTSISSNSVQALLCDREGRMWVGIAEGGVNVCDPSHGVFMLGSVDVMNGKGVSNSGTWSVYQHGKKLYVATSGGLDILDLKNERFSDAHSFQENVVARETISDFDGKEVRNTISICADGDRLWVGTRRDGLFLVENGKYTRNLRRENSSIGSNTIFHVMRAHDGMIWLSTIDGLVRMDPKDLSFVIYRNDPKDSASLHANYIISSFEDSRNRLWVATTNGLALLQPDGRHFRVFHSDYSDRNSLSYNIVTSVMEDSDHNIWVSTLGGGFDLYNEATGKFTVWDKESGLANDVVYGIIQDKQGLYWMFTNSGISRFDRQKKTFTNYYTTDGIIANEFSQNGFAVNSSGEIQLASPQGIMIFNPQNVSQVNRRIPCVLTELTVNYERLIPYDVAQHHDLTLYWDERQVVFGFSGLDYLASEKVNYQYKLEGLDKEWVSCNAGQRIASYTSLPYGEYVFKVRTASRPGAWTDPQLNIKVHVIPPFWLRTWFIIMEVVVAIILISLLARYFSTRKLKKKLREVEVQRKIQAEKERISRDLHDNVGAHLTYIINSLDNLAYRAGKKSEEKLEQKIDTLGEFARGTMTQLRETIWAINKESVTLEELKNKILQMATRFSSVPGSPDIEVELLGKKDIILQPSVAIDLFRVVQEALNNAMKHSNAKVISIRVEGKDDGILVSVKDNGMGFDPAVEKDGHYGLKNMNARLVIHKGNTEISSTPGNGTTVTFTLPFTRHVHSPFHL